MPAKKQNKNQKTQKQIQDCRCVEEMTLPAHQETTFKTDSEEQSSFSLTLFTMSIHNAVSDTLHQLEYSNVLRDKVRVSDSDIRFTHVTIRYARDPQRFFVAEVFMDDDGDYSGMILENNNFNTRIMTIFMDTLMENLTPRRVFTTRDGQVTEITAGQP